MSSSGRKQRKSRRWELRTLDGVTDLSEQLKTLQAQTRLSLLTLRACWSRGLTTLEKIQEFIKPSLASLQDPFSIQDMEKAVARVLLTKEKQQKIRVFADYDVDGTTGAALLGWFFREVGLSFDLRQPDRFKDGYGLNLKAVQQAIEDGVGLLITVDCGITSFEPIQYAKDHGLDLIIVDHHQLDPIKGMPAAFAVINPQRPDCQKGLRNLCGCGLAFYLCRALRSKAKELGWFQSSLDPNLKQHLDLVAIATAADQVSLVGDNRVLISHGLEVLKHTRKPGLKALMEVAGLTQRSIGPSHLAFTLGPRINASGRMDHAGHALNLLLAQDPLEGARLANGIEQLNQERALVQNTIWDQVRLKVDAGLAKGLFKNAVVVSDPTWHEGVVGIVASRVTEQYHKPAIVIAVREDLGKGSVRSYGGKDVLAAVRQCAELLLGFGGHQHAAGLSLKPENIEAFQEAFDQAVEKVSVGMEDPPLLIEGECAIEELADIQTLLELERLAPFGPGNPEPVFKLKAQILERRILKGRHLKLNLAPVGAPEKPVHLEAIWFHAAEQTGLVDHLTRSQSSEWVGVPELNRFRGKITPTLRVRDWRDD